MHKLGLGVVALLYTAPSFARSFPESLLPAYIHPVTDSGERPDWSLDGKRILFLNRSGGDVYEVNVATKAVRLIAKAPGGTGCWRALYLSNGDFFFTAGTGRSTAYAYVLDSGRVRPPVRINTIIHEGPAISRRQLKICYTNDDARIYIADIVYSNGIPAFANARVLIDNAKVTLNGKPIATGSVEPQNFVPPDESRLTFSAYGYNGGDGLLYNMSANSYSDFTNEPCYDEPEGVFPDGRFSLVESNRHVCTGGTGNVDIFRFSLSDTSKWVRLTHFNDYLDFKASNPVVSDDGKYFAFMESRASAATGVGFGIYVYDLAAAGYYNPPATAIGLDRDETQYGDGMAEKPGGPGGFSQGYNAAGRSLSAKARRAPQKSPEIIFYK